MRQIGLALLLLVSCTASTGQLANRDCGDVSACNVMRRTSMSEATRYQLFLNVVAIVAGMEWARNHPTKLRRQLAPREAAP